MAQFVSNALGNKGIAKAAGEKVGDLVEGTVNKVLTGGAEKKKKEEQKGGGFDIDGALSLDGDKKEGKGEGLDVKTALGGLFK